MRALRHLFETVVIAAAVSCIGLSNPALAQGRPPSTGGSAILPAPEPPFGGVIGRTAKESTPDFPKAVTAPTGAPNVLLIMTDDTGFGAASTFGGPIPTPTLDRVAKSGLRYNQFHTTALCSPTRGALLTGRNQLRSQFHHVIDIVPTILEAASIQAPRVLNGTPQKPMEGVSMVYTFDDCEDPDAAHDPVLRDDGQPRDLPRRLDGQHHATPEALGDPRRGARPRRVSRGSFTTSPRTSASPRTWRRRTPRSSSICNPAF